MNRTIVCRLLAVAFAFHLLPPIATAAIGDPGLFVAPDGSDENPGTMEKPFATIAKARDAVRRLKTTQQGPIAVVLRGGTYYLTEPLVFKPEDSGTQDAPILYVGWQDETPVLSGGAKLELKWEPYKDAILQAKVPADVAAFDQLFVDGVKQHLARYPSYDPGAQYFNGFAADCISPERVARWAQPAGAIVHAMHRSHWGDFHYVITGVDEKGNPKLEGGWQNNRRMGMHGSHRFVENVFEELDAPGEWYLDSEKNVLYFRPPDGVDPSRATIEVARLKHVVEFDGSLEKPVRFITLRGLTFRHTLRTFMVNNAFHPHVWYEQSGDVFRRNIVFTPHRPIRVRKPWGKEVDDNLLHTPGQTEPQPAVKLQEQTGRDEHSLAADAMFVEEASGNYQVKEDSPALRLGFKNFPMDLFGVISPKLKAEARTPALPRPCHSHLQGVGLPGE